MASTDSLYEWLIVNRYLGSVLPENDSFWEIRVKLIWVLKFHTENPLGGIFGSTDPSNQTAFVLKPKPRSWREPSPVDWVRGGSSRQHPHACRLVPSKRPAPRGKRENAALPRLPLSFCCCQLGFWSIYLTCWFFSLWCVIVVTH